MKKVLLLATVAIAFVLSANAQITKGSILLGGSIGINTNSTENQNGEFSSNSFFISPQIGYTVKNNNVWGLRLTYSKNNNQVQNFPETEGSGYGGGIFFRKYFPLSNRFNLLGEANANYASSNQDNGVNTEYKANATGLSLFPGISFTVNKRFHLEALLTDLFRINYLTEKITDKSGPSTTEYNNKSFSIGTNLSSQMPLTIGFRFVLGN